MPRTVLASALTLFVAVSLLALIPAAPAAAHGIIVTDGDVIIVVPSPPDRRRIPPRPANPIRLRAHRVEAVLQGRVADVTVEQTFHNDSGRQLEGTYLFPLPEGATVARFAMTMGGKMVEGEIMEADQARRIYHDIVRRRRDPGLLEYMGRGLFRAKVFPIMPHQDLTIRLTFQQVLPENDGTLEFRYPLSTERLHGTPVESVVISAKIEGDVDLKGIYSPSHDVAVARDGNRKAHASYESTNRKQDRDFLLYVSRSPDDVGFSLLSSKAAGEAGTFLAVLAPSSDVPDDQLAPKDVIYVLDTSGSMAQDDKIGQAKKALEYGVRVLNPKDRFNIVAFSGVVRPFRDGLMEASGEMKDAAAKWIGELRAQGGTNIEGALDQALGMGQDGRLLMIVFLTDGRPTLGVRDADALVKMVAEKNTSAARVFTFGVGFDLDVRLLDRIAETTHAARDYVMPREDLELATSRFFRKVNQPVMSDVTIEFGSGILDVYPKHLGDLFAGGQVVVMGRYQQPGDRVIRLKGKLGDRQVVHEYEATFGATETASYLARLWAHRKVGYLLDAIRLNGENKELVDEIVRLATRHGIVTPYTAGLVVEEGELLSHDGDVPPPPGRREAGVDALRRRLRPGGAGAPSAGPGFGGGAAGGPRPDQDPADTATPASPAPSPVMPPAPELEARDSRELRRLKDKGGLAGEETDADDAYGLQGVREKVKAVADKTFLQGPDGRWIDTAYDGKAVTVKVEAYSVTWTELMAKLSSVHGEKVSSYFSLGEGVVFVLGDKAYEILPPKE